MPTVDIRIPQMGEGLQEARLLRFLKRPGESVRRDEPVFEMETDKAVMEIESPAAGEILEWIVSEDDVLPIGAVIGGIRVEEEAPTAELQLPSAPLDSGQTAPVASTRRPDTRLSNTSVPPRSRAYARDRGVSDAELISIAANTEGKVLPQHIDAFLARRGTAAPIADYEDVPIGAAQRTLNYRLQQSLRGVIPASLEAAIDWEPIERARALARKAFRQIGAPPPTPFMLYAWCVARAARDFPRFRSAFTSDTMLRCYRNLHIGIAVAREDDELVMARIPLADTLGPAQFVAAAWDAIRRAQRGEDQATGTMQLSLSNLAANGVVRGTPVIVAPAVATLFVGTPHDVPAPGIGGSVTFRRIANAVLTFDHRVVNGVGAARFLGAIRASVQELPDMISALSA